MPDGLGTLPQAKYEVCQIKLGDDGADEIKFYETIKIIIVIIIMSIIITLKVFMCSYMILVYVDLT